MSYILCRTKTTKVPFYIDNISTNIYSIEELCFYLYNNIYLIDETLLNEKLCFWLRDELGLDALSRRLMVLMDQEAKISDLILPIFKEIHYLSHEEFRMLTARLSQFEAQPMITRQKIKGDYLFGHEKYMNAVKVYKECLKLQEKDTTGTQFIGSVCYNMGCAYARLLWMEEARECFRKAYGLLHTRNSLMSYLIAVYMAEDEEHMQQEAKASGVDEKTMAELKLQIEEAMDELWNTPAGKRYAGLVEKREAGDVDAYENGVRNMLKEFTDSYHRNTGF